MEKKGPLVGTTVLDWTQWQFGPAATAMLGDLGADIIHIEYHNLEPGRGMSVPEELIKGRNTYFEVNNRGKKSITINLQSDEGREVLYRLVKKADVFVHNYRPGVPERLKVGYDTLKQYNPKLIYAAASGFGTRGPDVLFGAFDSISCARSGFADLFGSADKPGISHYGGLNDQMGAIFLAYGVLAALIARDKYGVGQRVDVSLLMSMMTLQGLALGMTLYRNKSQAQQDRRIARNPLWNFYKCKDEKWIVMAMPPVPHYWAEVCKAIGAEYLIDDPRFKDGDLRKNNSRDLVIILDKIFAEKTAAEWNKILHDGYDTIATLTQSLNDLVSDPQVIANNYIIDYNHEAIGPVKVMGLPVELSETPGRVNAEAPELGQHTEEVLTELAGYTQDEITTLREKKAI